MPWADLALFAVIGGLVVVWWLRPGGAAGSTKISLLAPSTPTVVAALAAPGVGGPEPVPAALELKLPTPVPPTATATPTATSTPEPTATQSNTRPAAPTPIIYKVQNGDLLAVIADRYDTTVKAIIDANGLTADGFIRVGQELIIPGRDAGAQPAAQPTATPTGGTLVYRVSAGDTIAVIAARYGSTVEWILAANKMGPNDLLSIVQSLLIPLSNSTPTATPTSTAVPPTATPTPGLRYQSPVPVSPLNDSQLAANGFALLSWTSVGMLEENEWYVVTLTTADGKPVAPTYWTKSTNWRLVAEDRATALKSRAAVGAASAGSAEAPTLDCRWQVRVMTGEPGKPGPAVSPDSEVYRFRW